MFYFKIYVNTEKIGKKFVVNLTVFLIFIPARNSFIHTLFLM